MTACKPLADFLIPIESGLTPADIGELSPGRAALLDAQLRELAAARAQAWVEIRTYPVTRGTER